MKPAISRALVALGALLILGALNTAIVGKERIKRSGELVYLPLAPVDPRSLIQGDYMALRFAIVRDIEGRDEKAARAAREGETAFAPVTLDDQRVASLATDAAPASLKLRYRIRNGQVWLGTNAFFFEEGSAERYAGARYGEFRVDRDSGEAVLVGLRSDTLEAL
ncbi:MAG: GDYXXLXY domain-containing protein [Burkholderiales bacterium]